MTRPLTFDNIRLALGALSRMPDDGPRLSLARWFAERAVAAGVDGEFVALLVGDVEPEFAVGRDSMALAFMQLGVVRGGGGAA